MQRLTLGVSGSWNIRDEWHFHFHQSILCMMENWSQSHYLNLGFGCYLLALWEPENWYFRCIFAVQPERGRYRTWAKFLTVLVTMSAVPTISEWKAVAAKKSPKSEQEGRARWRPKRRTKEREEKPDPCLKTLRIINTEKNSQTMKIGR